MSFDPTKPIDDPSVWFPQGMYVQQKRKDGEKPVFILADTDMSSLNRYAWTGRLLATTRDEYTLSLGINDNSEISEPVWGAVDTLLGKYKTVSTPIPPSEKRNDSTLFSLFLTCFLWPRSKPIPLISLT